MGIPDWVGDLLALIAAVTGLPAIILWFLNRKNANRKLDVDEGGLTVSQFNAALPAYQDMLNRATAAAEKAEHEKDAAEELVRNLSRDMDVVENKLNRMILLFRRVLTRAAIQLTQDEMDELEATQPVPRRDGK